MDLKEVDQLIKSGAFKPAWDLIKSITPSDVERSQLKTIADYATRVGQPLFALKTLGRVMKNHREGIEQASADEVFTYVSSLIRLGFLNEAKRVLGDYSGLECPEVYNLLARAEMGQWNYKAAASLLKRFLEATEPDSYSHLVGSLNLAACLAVVGDVQAAHKTIRTVIKKARASKAKLILGNAYELQAQNYLEAKDYDKAKASLERSQKIFGGGASVWSFYAEKWKFQLELLVNGAQPDLRSQGFQLVADATSKGFFEGVRDIERMIAVAWDDEQLLYKVYFGSRNEHYRERLLKSFTRGVTVPEAFVWKRDLGREVTNVLDLSHDIEQTEMQFHLLKVLLHDLYRPVSIGYIFSQLYPSDFFDPFHSSDRIYAQVKKLRSHFKARSELTDLEVTWAKGAAQLSFSSSTSLFLTSKTSKPVSKMNQNVVALREYVGKQWFQTSQVGREFSVSTRSVQRWLEEARVSYKIEEAGSGRAKRYRFK